MTYNQPTELQRVSRIKTWILHFQLHDLHAWHTNQLRGASACTRQLIEDRSALTKLLKESIEADYQRFKADVLSKREAGI